MHFYNAEQNFFGGNGIVGAQVPVGVGLAFAQKYQGKKACTIAMYGDGAANQGQIYEASNMAGLWNLPCIFLIENNLYGMGTSSERHSHNTEYYKRGDLIPGIRADGQNIFNVKEIMKWSKERCVAGKGPIFLELMTYRYHGHSMSDPGVTYRTRDEIQQVRQERDPIEVLKKIMLDNKLAEEAELKQIDKDIKKGIDKDIEQIKKDPLPGAAELYNHVGIGKTDVRGVEYGLSQWQH